MFFLRAFFCYYLAKRSFFVNTYGFFGNDSKLTRSKRLVPCPSKVQKYFGSVQSFWTGPKRFGSNCILLLFLGQFLMSKTNTYKMRDYVLCSICTKGHLNSKWIFKGRIFLKKQLSQPTLTFYNKHGSGVHSVNFSESS